MKIKDENKEPSVVVEESKPATLEEVVEVVKEKNKVITEEKEL